MGRITLFVMDYCPDSLRVVMALKALGIPYRIINVSKFPDKRQDMVSLSKHITTPQVFLNTRHVGGANEAIKLLQEWDETCNGSSCGSTVSSSSEGSWSPSSKKFIHGRRRSSHAKQVGYESVRERYEAEVGKHPDPVDARFAVPDTAPAVESPFPRVPSEVSCICLPNEDLTSVVEMTEMLKDLIKRNVDNEAGGVSYKRSFFGHKLITVLCGVFVVSSKTAFAFAQQLLALGIIHSLQESSGNFNSKFIYRLQCNHTPDILNSYRIWTERVDTDSFRLLKGLANMLRAVEMAATDMSGNRSLKKAVKLSEFIAFEEAVCELQGMNLKGMDDSTMLAFGVTLYNLMIKYAHIKVGVVSADSKSARDVFFSTIKFDIGGHLYSFNDWENGILRGNAAVFDRKDPRAQFCVKTPDPRIVFALYRGPNAPTLHVFSPETLSPELNIFAANFCDDRTNVIFDKKAKEVYLSEAFRLYRDDLAPSEKELPMAVTNYMKGIRKQKLERLIDSCGSQGLEVKYIPFEWECPKHEDSCLIFEPSALKMEQSRGLRGFIAGNMRIGARQ